MVFWHRFLTEFGQPREADPQAMSPRELLLVMLGAALVWLIAMACIAAAMPLQW